MGVNKKSLHLGLTPIDDSMLSRESWKIFQIMAEFVEGFERLARISPSVSIFGSARFRERRPKHGLQPVGEQPALQTRAEARVHWNSPTFPEIVGRTESSE